MLFIISVLRSYPEAAARIVFCADCGRKLYLHSRSEASAKSESLRCATYARQYNECSAHYIRTCILKELVLGEINKLLVTVHNDEDAFVERSMEQSATSHLDEVKKAKKLIAKDERRMDELDRLFKRLYEDNVLSRINDERFAQMSADYADEQRKLRKEAAKASRERTEKQRYIPLPSNRP